LLADRVDDISLVEAGFIAANEHWLSEEMIRAIAGFDLDDEGHWRAKLECGHYQHVRHEPPMTVREWTLTEAGRASRVGYKLNCLKCDQKLPADF
jgi:hypothetical protein